METIFILGASQAFFLSLLVFNKKNKSTGDFVLAIWLGFIGLHLLDYHLQKTGFYYQHPHLLGIGACFPLLQGPFMFVYVLVMIGFNDKLKPTYWLHGLPFLVFTIYFIFDFYFLSASEKLAYIKLQETEPNISILILNILVITLGPIYVILSYLKLRKHTLTISQNFSYTEKINLNWIKFVLIGLGFIWFTVIFTNILVIIPIITDKISENIIYMSVVIVVFVLGYFGLKQQTIYSHNAPVTSIRKGNIHKGRYKKGNRYVYSNLTKTKAEEYINKLLEYFNQKKPYLNGELSLKEVADTLNIPMNHLSQIINEHLGKSFFVFVNTYRVEEVIMRLSDPQNKKYTFMAIAYDSGFNSKSSFNRIFKDLVGLTPSEFMKQKID